ncbi:MAG: PAS domain S-box protein [Ignavibacteriaceae bacterium]|nr:PAS domain S-box protein [Ignavibacteriaceae bacterium]
MKLITFLKKYFLRYETIVWLTPIVIILSLPQLFNNLFISTSYLNLEEISPSQNIFWLHVGSDLVLGLANLIMTFFIVIFVIRASKDLPFPRLFLAFGLCTVSNSAVYFMSIWSLSIFYPYFFGLIKLIAAVSNLITVGLLPYFGPKVLVLMRNSRILKATKINLQATNLALENQILERMQAEEELIRIQNELELRVNERTAQLEKMNKALLDEIHEKNKAESALRDRETLFRQLAENIRDVFFIIKPENQRISYLSPAYEQVWGYSLKSAYDDPKSLFAHVHPEDQKKLDSIFKISSHKGIVTDSYRIKRPDGKIRWVRIRVFPIFDESDKLNRIAGVAEDITIRKQYEQRLEYSLKEKEILLKEIHHRVKNNMQIISSLLNLQAKYIGDEHTSEIFHEGRNRIRTMALIHEKLYGPKDFTRINFAEYLNELCSYLLNAYKIRSQKVGIKIDIEDIYLDLDQSLTLGFIVNELVSNSLKYAFPNGLEGQIKISLKSSDKQNILKVYDNGVGISSEIELGKTNTLGLQLVQMFCEQISGTVTLRRGEGTEFLISFAKA